MTSKRFFVRLVALLLAIVSGHVALAEEASTSSGISSQLDAAKAKILGEQEYELRYKFRSGDALRWQVVHLATTETQIRGNTQTAKSRSLSTKLWRVSQCDAEGNMTFTHTVENVDMWQQVSDRPEIRFNSQKDEQAPPEYQDVAKTLGQPLSAVTIRPNGEVVRRDSDSPHVSFGIGGIVMLLPAKPVRLGGQWQEPSEVQVRLPDGRVQRVKTRKLYTLQQVQTAVATISVKTEVLTPVTDARIQAQIVQQLTNGTVRFDVDAGRILSRQMDWDETVVGFNGADSMMKYLARFTEELLDPTATATNNSSTPGDQPAAVPAKEDSTARKEGVTDIPKNR